MKKRKNKNIIISFILIGLAIYFIFPFYWLIISTTKNVSQLFHKSLLPGKPNHFIENIQSIFSYENGIFFKWMGNSFLYAIVGAFLAIFIACLVGYAFRRYDFYGKRIVFILILGFSMVPVYATTLPLFMFFKDLALINTRLAILLPSFVNVFSVYLMVSYWNQIPDEVFSAAEIDGASDWLIFYKIGLPNIIPGFITLFLLHFVTIWNNFFLPLVLLNTRTKMPLILGITTITDSQGHPVYNLTLTASLFTILPLLILFISLQKYFKPQFYSSK